MLIGSWCLCTLSVQLWCLHQGLERLKTAAQRFGAESKKVQANGCQLAGKTFKTHWKPRGVQTQFSGWLTTLLKPSSNGYHQISPDGSLRCPNFARQISRLAASLLLLCSSSTGNRHRSQASRSPSAVACERRCGGDEGC